MPIDYTQLQSDTALWTARTDLGPIITTAIVLAEAEISRVVRMFEQETDLDIILNPADGTGTLPTDFLGFKHVVIKDSNTPETEYHPPTDFAILKQQGINSTDFPHRTAPLKYTIESGKIKTLMPGSSGAITLDTAYFKRFEALSGSNTSNVLLQNHYDVYLWGALVQVWDYADETEQVAKYQAKFDRAVTQLTDQEVKRRQPSGPLVRRPPNRRP